MTIALMMMEETRGSKRAAAPTCQRVVACAQSTLASIFRLLNSAHAWQQ
jgi:hypothetical protein